MTRVMLARDDFSSHHRSHRWLHWSVRLLAVLAALYLVLVASAAISNGAELTPAHTATPRGDFQAQLAAGEFAPALAQAQQLAGNDRDVAIGQLAVAQVAGGARRAALQTAALIDDSETLADTLDRYRNQPFSRGAFGGTQADFDSLIDLITSTIAPTSWDDVGGPGSIDGFEGGVYVDALGLLSPVTKADRSGGLAELRRASFAESKHDDVRQTSRLRKVSLVRLERQAALRAAQGLPPSDDMATLAGLKRVKYVLVYPDQGDIVLAGPAGNWRTDTEGRLVGTETGRPVVRLDDFLVVARHLLSAPDARFGCSITPKQDALASVQEFLAQSTKSPLKPGGRDAWLNQLRAKLGQQTIETYGIDPQTRVGRVLVEADYRMKLVGMELEDGVLGVPSYLSSITVPPGGSPPPMDVLRWWFTLNYDAVFTTAERDAFEFRGQGVKVLSENELLTATGQRQHTGKSQPLNEEFARNFTKHFAALAAKYPVYAELQNICDLALVAAVLRAEELPQKARWPLAHFSDAERSAVELSNAPKAVQTVINHRVIGGKHIIVGISGGVRIDPQHYVEAEAIKTDTYGLIRAEHTGAAPKKDLPRDRWWWD